MSSASSSTKACPICASRRFRRDRSGVVVCEEGHVLQGFRTEEMNVTEASRHVTQKRTLRKLEKRRRKKREKGEVDPNVFQGDAKHYVRLELLQLLLRHLVKSATAAWRLPVEVEAMARELWALVLALFPLPPPPRGSFNPPPATHIAAAQPHGRPTSNSKPPFPAPGPGRLGFSATQPAPGQYGVSDRSRQVPDPVVLTEESDKETSSLSSGSDGESSDLSETQKDAPAAGGRGGDETAEGELDEELLEQIEALSESDGDSTTSHQPNKASARHLHGRKSLGRPRGKIRWRKDKLKLHNKITAQTVLSVFLLSLYMARVPFLISDIIRAIDDGTLPYVDFGHSRYIPDSMKPYLARELRDSTWARRAPSVKGLYLSVRHLVDLLELTFGLRIPDLNAAPILWRVVQRLGGSPPIYLYAFQILRLLDVPLTVSRPEEYALRTIVDAERKAKRKSLMLGSSEDDDSSVHSDQTDEDYKNGQQRPRRRHIAADMWPEARIVMAVVMVLKMIYGLDGRKRRVTSHVDVAIGIPDFDTWQSALHEASAAARKGFDMTWKPKDFLDTPDDDMDAFLDQASRALLAHQHSSPSDHNILEDLFPLEAPGRRHISTRPARKRGKAPDLSLPLRADSDLQPGEQYLICVQDGDDEWSLPAEAVSLYRAASELVGISLERFMDRLSVFEWQAKTEHDARARAGGVGSRKASRSAAASGKGSMQVSSGAETDSMDVEE